MLKEMRRHSKSVIVWLLFGILIAVFVIGFGTPGTEQLSCGSTTKIGEIDGQEISREDYSYAIRFMMREGSQPVEKAIVLDLLLRREILAQAASRAGFRTAAKPDDASDDADVADMLAKRRLIVLGNEMDLYAVGGWPGVRTSKGKFVPAKNFNYDHFKKWSLWRFGMTVHQFMVQQQRELLAKHMMDTIQAGVQISEEETKAFFEYQNHSLTIQVARFDVATYRKGIAAAETEVQQFLKDKDRAAKVDRVYGDRYKDKKDFPDQRFLRHILFKWEPKADDARKKAVRLKLAQLRRGLKPGNFAARALAASQDDATRDSGGLLGWKSKDDLKHGKEFAEAVFKLKDGEISQPLESKDGYHVVLVHARRKDTWPLEKARPFLAEELVIEQKAEERTRTVARACLQRLRAGKSMEEVFSGAPPKEEKKDAKDAKKEKARANPPPRPGARPGKAKPEPAPIPGPLPQVQEVVVTRTQKRVQHLEELTDLAPKIWTLSNDKPLLGNLLELKHSGQLMALGIVRFKELSLPDMQEFEAQKTSLMDQYLKTKQQDALNRWVRHRCEQLAKKGRIWIDERYTKIVDYPKDPKGGAVKPVTIKYNYCKLLPRHATEAFWR